MDGTCGSAAERAELCDVCETNVDQVPTGVSAYYPGKEVGQAFQPDKAHSQAGKPDLQCVSFVPG